MLVGESRNLDHINISLILKVIPFPIAESNFNQLNLYDFKIFQESLIAFKNLEIVNAFEYFDRKNR